MKTSRTLPALLLVGPLACGDAVSGDAGATTGSVDPSTSLPTTGDAPTTAGSATSEGTSATAGTGDGSSGGTTFASTSSSEPGVDASSSTSGESSGDEGTTAEETTTAGGVCGSDTAADPAPWSLARGVPGENLATWWIGGGAGSIVYTLMHDDVLDLGGGPIDPAGADHVFFAAHAPTGEFQWSEHLGGGASEISHWLAASDCAGNIVVAGQFHGDISTQGVHLVATPGVEFEEGMPFPTVDWFVLKLAPDGPLLWARRFGDGKSQRVSGLTLQSDGSIIVSGTVNGTLDLGGPPIVVDGVHRQAVLAAFTPDGAFAWQQVFASTVGVDLGAIDVGGDDRISAFAQTPGPLDLGGGVLPDNGEGTVLVQFAADGGHLWSQRWQHPMHKPFALKSDADGGVVVTGYRVGGDETFPDFILRHDGEGAFAWDLTYVLEPGKDELIRIEAMLVHQEIVVTGTFIGTVDLGGGVLDSPAPLRTMFLARYDLTGGYIASETHAATLGTFPSALAYGPDGELVLGGAFAGALDLGGGPLQSVGERDLFLHRYAP